MLNWQLATGNWQPATGNWQLATGYWQLAAGNLIPPPPRNRMAHRLQLAAPKRLPATIPTGGGYAYESL